MKKRIAAVVMSAIMAVGCFGINSTVFASKGQYSDDYNDGYEAGYRDAYEAFFGGGSEGDSWGGWNDDYYGDYDDYYGDYYDEWDDDYYGDYCYGDDCDDDYYDEGYSSGDSFGDSWGDEYDDTYHTNNTQADESELATWDTGIGTAGELDGNIVVVSIYVDDSKTSWDFSKKADLSTREDTLTYLKMATDWISEQGNKWGSNPVFIYDWEQDDELYYEASIRSDVTSDDEDDDVFGDVSKYIKKNIDSEGLLKKYNADSIVYMTYYNTSYRNDSVSYTYAYDDESEYEYEICYILVRSDGEDEAPAAYAHEMLHTFGAPDLYTSEYPEWNYNIVNSFVEYCESYYPNEIMLTTYDVDTNEAYYDRISNELTQITAYYIGWVDECDEVEEFNLQPSQYVTTGR